MVSAQSYRPLPGCPEFDCRATSHRPDTKWDPSKESKCVFSLLKAIARRFHPWLTLNSETATIFFNVIACPRLPHSKLSCSHKFWKEKLEVVLNLRNEAVKETDNVVSEVTCDQRCIAYYKKVHKRKHL